MYLLPLDLRHCVGQFKIHIFSLVVLSIVFLVAAYVDKCSKLSNKLIPSQWVLGALVVERVVLGSICCIGVCSSHHRYKTCLTKEQ